MITKTANVTSVFFTLVRTAIFILAVTPVVALSSEPDFDNVRSGTLFLYENEQRYDALLLNSKVSMHIAGVVADVQLSQQFENTSADWVEGMYAFPLPENASVRSMKIRIGERTIIGKIQERQLARQKYHAAAANGQVAGLVNQERANLFTTRIANIAPGEEVHIELDYFQTLEVEDNELELRLPATFTPRYFPPSALSAENFAENPQKTLLLLDEINELTPEFSAHPDETSHRLTLDILIDSEIPLSDIRSDSHDIDIAALDNAYKVSASTGQIPMDRDFLLRWTLAPSESPYPALYVQETDKGRFGLVIVNPPFAENPESAKLAREVIFVLDTSGSMSGNSIRAAKSALSRALDAMTPADRFNIIQFNDRARQLFKSPQPANPNLIANGKNYIRSLDADGGTEMQAAVELALQNQDKRFLRQIVFITDGSVGNEQDVFRTIQRELGDARFFTVGIGTAPNTFFMRQAALSGRGTYSYISTPQQSEIEISRLLEQMSSPVLTSLSIKEDGKAIEQFFPHPVPDLYAGKPLALSVKLSDNGSNLTLTGRYTDKIWEQTLPIRAGNKEASGIASLWARQKIEQLMNKQWLHADNELHKQEIIEISSTWGVLSHWTSFLAIEETPVRHTRTTMKSESLNSLLPAGSSGTSIPMPQGATGVNAWLAAAIILLLIGVALNADRLRPEESK